MKEFLRFLSSMLFVKHLLITIVAGILIIFGTLWWLNIYTDHGDTQPVPDYRGMTVEEAKEVLEEQDLVYEITDSVYLVRKEKGAIVEQNPRPGFQVKEGRTIFFTLNAVKPKMVQMPNVKGVSFRQAKAIIETNNLRVGSLQYQRDMAINNVLEQKYNGDTIKPGTRIPQYSKIDLVLGSGVETNYTYIPNLLRDELSQAKEEILNAYCNIGDIMADNTVQTYSDSLKAQVWQQSPNPRDRANMRLGTEVDIWITNNKDKLPSDSLMHMD